MARRTKNWIANAAGVQPTAIAKDLKVGRMRDLGFSQLEEAILEEIR